MDAGRINIIKNSLGNYNVTFEDINGTLCIVIDKKDVLDITGLIKTQLGFDLQVDAVSIDRYKKENRFEMIYNLY